MGVYKNIDLKDITITKLNTNQLFEFYDIDLIDPNIGIEFLYGNNIQKTYTGLYQQYTSYSIFHSIETLYYSNYSDSPSGSLFQPPIKISGTSPEYDVYISKKQSPIFDNYLQSSLTPYRNLKNECFIISIPIRYIGNNILPKSFNFYYDDQININDDGEGNIIENDVIIGNILYGKGIIVITSEPHIIIFKEILAYLENFKIFPPEIPKDIKLSYSNEFDIYETQYKCHISSNEFNISSNKTLLLEGDTLPEYTQEAFYNPYITCIGLYNDNNELIAVGKLSYPHPLSNKIDTTIQINLDLNFPFEKRK